MSRPHQPPLRPGTKQVLGLLLAALVAITMFAGCASSTPSAATLAAPAATTTPVQLDVSAATTLKKAFTILAPAFEKANNAKLVYNFGASGVLQKQVEGGAPCDVFASASPSQVSSLVADGLVSVESTVTFAGNTLVIIVPANNPAGITGPNDLAKANKIVTGNPATAPHGAKAKEFLTMHGTWDSLQPKMVFADNAAQTLDYVVRGEVDAGLIFGNEVLANKDVKVVFTVPDGAIKPIKYVAAPIKASKNLDLATKFTQFLLTPEAQTVLVANGFKPAPTK